MTDLIQACEADLRSGRISHAAAKLRTVRPEDIPREFRVTLANLCRRAQMDYQALKILAPVVRPSTMGVAATSEEQAEYAVGLLKIGAIPEAISILERVQHIPEAKLFKAYCHFKLWEYKKSIPLLKEYIASAPSDYMKTVGQVNLAAAYSATLQLEPAREVLREIIEFTDKEGHRRLWANAFEILSQIHIHEGHYAQAREDLQKAATVLTHETADGLLIERWNAILKTLETKDASHVENFRKKAIRAREWESLRDLDFFALQVNFNETTYRHLIVGTPFAEFRERIHHQLQKSPDGTSLLLGSSSAPRFVVATGEVQGLQTSAPGNTVHQLIAVLLSDLYRPWSVGSIFNELFPQEHFDVNASPNRVHQLLWRLRRWFESNNIPVTINEFDGNYRLEIQGDFAFELPAHKIELDEQEIYMRKLNSLFGKQVTFSSRDVQAKLGISSSSFKRLASWAIENKRFERMGASRATVYRIVA